MDINCIIIILNHYYVTVRMIYKFTTVGIGGGIQEGASSALLVVKLKGNRKELKALP